MAKLPRLPDACVRCGHTILSWRWVANGPIVVYGATGTGEWYVRCYRCQFTALPDTMPPKRRWTLGDQDAETDMVSKRFAGLEVD